MKFLLLILVLVQSEAFSAYHFDEEQVSARVESPTTTVVEDLGKREVAFQFSGRQGQYPSASFFLTGGASLMAKQAKNAYLNAATTALEKDPKNKQLIALKNQVEGTLKHAGITFTLEGIRFMPVRGNPELVEAVVITDAVEVRIPGTIKKSDLAGPKGVKIAFQKEKSSYLGTGAMDVALTVGVDKTGALWADAINVEMKLSSIRSYKQRESIPRADAVRIFQLPRKADSAVLD